MLYEGTVLVYVNLLLHSLVTSNRHVHTGDDYHNLSYI